MAKTMTLATLSILSSLLLLGSVAGKPNGLTIELIHRDSPESPLYPGNLPFIDRIQRLVNQSKARAYYLSNMASANTETNSSRSIHPNEMIIRAPIAIQQMSIYMVRVGIGTFNRTFPEGTFKTYHLHMDTGSDLTWTQCEDCQSPNHHCFPCTEPPFPNSLSTTYSALPCNSHQLCEQDVCTGDSCSYRMRYLDGATTTGILSQERFTFASKFGSRQELSNLVFGCTIYGNDMKYGDHEDSQVSGIFALGWGPRSFANQIDPSSQGTFSYCLKFNDGNFLETYLRFGADISQPGGLQTTKITKNERFAAYYIDLLGISVNGIRLDIDPELFSLRPDGSGGCIIDSGSTFTDIIKPAHEELVKTLLLYFSSFRNLTRSSLFEGSFDLCFERRVLEGFKNLPSLTFHLRNADLEVAAEGTFFVKELVTGGEVFCLAIVPDDSSTVLGAYQQTNQKFIYDIRRSQLQFAPENCAQNA